jgi:HAE1 family hydrophobic/amphiphilic exporter-1
MVFTALTLVGAFAYTRLAVDLFPELDFPSISVVATYPGVSPEEIETLLTRPIEAAV